MVTFQLPGVQFLRGLQDFAAVFLSFSTFLFATLFLFLKSKSNLRIPLLFKAFVLGMQQSQLNNELEHYIAFTNLREFR